MSASLATRRSVALFLAAGTLIGAAALPAVADDHDHDHGQGRDHRGSHSSLVIGEVQYDIRGRGNRALNREWVEIKNTGRHGVRMLGFTLTDRDGNRYRFDDFRLAGRSTVRVHTGMGRDGQDDVFMNRRQQIWDDRDTATLRDNHGRVVDTMTWGHRGDHRRHHGHHGDH
ncbi:lamin tail domain-containing protein [Streptomyces sp. WAC06614]|uniref:lamin tail domain-containing protein n=1 Tax=Streptomyces sp. WAC06614 TaxID=2487416 RepID=UPI000F76926B|nr:lamin tail domain-containing protein [Streptomyces sp. WAC06614]RSS61789.1 lamin tail domain-containing protein [Streptomyces sp. WAC06614]